MTIYSIYQHLNQYGNCGITKKMIEEDEKLKKFVKKHKIKVDYFENGGVVLSTKQRIKLSEKDLDELLKDDRKDKYL